MGQGILPAFTDGLFSGQIAALTHYNLLNFCLIKTSIVNIIPGCGNHLRTLICASPTAQLHLCTQVKREPRLLANRYNGLTDINKDEDE